jgi:hypothetical protein
MAICASLAAMCQVQQALLLTHTAAANSHCCCRCCCCCCWCRSDDLEGLKLWAPKLADLELRACFSLECVRLMEDLPGSPVTPIRVRPMAATDVALQLAM